MDITAVPALTLDTASVAVATQALNIASERLEQVMSALLSDALDAAEVAYKGQSLDVVA